MTSYHTPTHIHRLGYNMSESGSLFDIMGPVMIGPSSSHTAGAVRLALLARNVANRPIKQVTFHLYNSFAKTYQGHGTDKGLVAGILGYSVHDESIRNVLDTVTPEKLQYAFVCEPDNVHLPPNTVQFSMILDNDEALSVWGHSIGGGKVYVSKINDYAISIQGEYPTIIMFYTDTPGMIWRVTKIIAEHNINIASLSCNRQGKGSKAFMIIALDNPIGESDVAAIREIPGVYSVRFVDKIPS